MTNATIPAESLAALRSALFRWEVPKTPCSVYLSLDVVDRMERETLEAFKAITRKGSEIGGILLGRTAEAGKRIITIEEYESIDCDYARGPLYILADADRKRIEQAIARLKTGGGSAGIVGFFRSNTRRDIALDDDDLAVMRDYFADPSNVCLLVKPFAMKPSTGAFFLWQDGQIKGDECLLPFAFKRAELETQFANLIVQPDDPSLSIFNKPAPSPAPAQSEKPAPNGAQAAKQSAPPAKVAPAQPKREEKPAVQPLPFKRDERPAITPQARPDARPAGPVLVKKEDPAPSKPEEKPAIQPVVKREEKPAAAPVRNAAPITPAKDKEKEKEPEVKAAAFVPEPAPVPKADPPKAAPVPQTFSPLSGTVEPAKPSIFANKWIWIGLIVVLLGGGAAYKFLFTGNAAQQTAQTDALSLRVERNAGQLLLTWNRNASAIQTASRATLTINDGDHREDADLDLGLLRSGNVVYTPMTNDVSFRLEVTDVKGGKSVSESMRVLAGRPSPAPVDAQASGQQAPVQSAQQKLTPVTAPEPSRPAAEEQASSNTSRAAQQPKPEVTATPVVTAEPPKPESLAARLSAPPSISAPPTLQSTASLGSGVAIPTPITAAAPPPAAPAQAASQPARQNTAAGTQAGAPPKIGGMVQDARLIKREMPVYPSLARNARVSGTVRVEAVIGPDGKVKSARALQGPPLLRQAAADAVKKWMYQPAMLNGQPTESTTQIDLLFAPTSK